MTKFEWERQLKKGISTLPQSEQSRVLDFYNELFADKLECNLREEEIIAEFGNPFDVANRLIVDYYNDGNRDQRAGKNTYQRTDRVVYEDFEADERKAKENFARASRENTKNNNGARVDKEPHLTDKQKKKISTAHGIIWPVATILFFIYGGLFGAWHPAWMLFIAAVVASSLCDAIIRRNAAVFAYPVLMTLLFLMLGFTGGVWHPAWILFVTIPLYYTIVGNLRKSAGKDDVGTQDSEPAKDNSNNGRTDSKYSYSYNYNYNSNNPSSPRASSAPISQPAKTQQSGWQIFTGVILTIAFVWLAIVIWSTVIGLFIAGIAMSAAGVVVIYYAILEFSISFGSAMALLGGGLFVTGLGLLFVTGMSAAFKGIAKFMGTLFKSSTGLISGKGE